MSKIKKLKISFICIITAYLIYSLFSHNSLAANINSTSNINEKKNKESQTQNSSIFSVKFVEQLKLKDKLQNSIFNDLSHNHESLNQNSFNDINNINPNIDNKPENFNIVFDNSMLGISAPPANHLNNESSYSTGPSVDDSLYMKNNPPSSKLADDKSYGETIFVTDEIENKLISCTENNGAYKCHTAVSNLNNPQDILIIRNSIYIANSHTFGESGDIVKCNINNTGYIDGCAQTAINMKNPTFFYYSPPYVHISNFVYSGGPTKPTEAIQCSIDTNGSFTNCNEDRNTISMSYISKHYNNAYYRTYSKAPPSAIENCSTADAVFCNRMPNELLVSPLSLSINHDRIFISNSKPNTVPDILKCSMDMKNCSVVTNEIKSPMCIGVYNF